MPKTTYKIVGKYKGKSEDVETEIETKKDALYLLREYQIAFGPDWLLKIVKER